MREIGDYSICMTHLSISFAGDAMYQREVKGKLIRLTNSSADILEMYSDNEKNAKYRHWQSCRVDEFNLTLARLEVHERRSLNRKEIGSAFLQDMD